MSTPPEILIPTELLPADGRFGAGPSKVRDAQVDYLASGGRSPLGTSHRQAPVKSLVNRIRTGLAEMFDLPDGYEVALGNGGATAFWDIATFSLVEDRASHGAFGEFSSKFARATSTAPFLKGSLVNQGAPGTVVMPEIRDDVDVYAWPHNETSTGAMAPVERLEGARDALTVIDATSAAGGLAVDVSQTDAYYFAPQKAFAADGGLWLAFLSPAAVERAERLAKKRWIPEILSLKIALDNSRLDQTLNTPAVATLMLLADQVDWLNAQGGLAWAAGRTAESAGHLYSWAEERSWATPYVAEVANRSHVVGTIDIDESIDATQIVAALRSNGVVDVFPYRKLGRNQLRVGMFPAVEPADVALLTQSIDFVVDRLGESS